MTTAIPTQPLTAAAFLFGEGQDGVKTLAHALNEHGVLGSFADELKNLSRTGFGAVGRQLATAAHGLLDLDLGDLAVGGWCKFKDVTKAVERTIASPGSSEIVDLATHSITSTHSPHVELIVNDAHVATMRFDLSIKFTVKGLGATIRDGRLVSLHSGACDVLGTLVVENRQLAKREGHFELPLLVRVGDGIRRRSRGGSRATGDGRAVGCCGHREPAAGK